MARGKSAKRRIDRKIIQRHGLDTVLLRSNNTVDEKDDFGEPIIPSSGWFDRTPLRIVVDSERLKEDQGLISLTNDKWEVLFFYVSGDTDIRIGDKILYPPGTDNEWLVKLVDPQALDGVIFVNEVKAFRDDRT